MNRINIKGILLIFSCAAAIVSCGLNKSRSQTSATSLEQKDISPFFLEKNIIDTVDCIILFESILPSGACIYNAEVRNSNRLGPFYMKVRYNRENDFDCMKEKINNGDLKAESLLLNFIKNEYNYYNKYDKNQGQFCSYFNGLEDMRSPDF